MPKILIVDDEEQFRARVQTILESKGLDTILARSGPEGINSARLEVPDLVICDVNMDEGDGYAVLEALRSDPSTAGIPFILMTGSCEGPEGVRRGMDLGADDYLIKPFAPDALLAAVDARLKKQQAHREHEKQTQARLVAILEATTDLVAIVDARTQKVLYLNRAGRGMMGISATEDVRHLRIQNIHSAQVLEVIEHEGIPKALRDGVWIGETAILSQSGREIPVSQVILAHRDAGGSVEYFSTIVRDITERKQMEEARVQLAAIIESSDDAIISKSLDGLIISWNPGAEKLFGYPAKEALGKPMLMIIPSERAGEELEILKRIESGQIINHFETVRVKKDGKAIDVSVTISPIKDSRGKIVGASKIARDITEQKRLEKERSLMEIQLRQALKLESIGQLAAGIAHEINTPTQYIGDNTRFVQDTFGDLLGLLAQYEKLLAANKAGHVPQELIAEVDSTLAKADLGYLIEEIPKAIAQSLQGVERVTKIVRAMKDFSHPGTDEKTPLDLNKAIDSTITVARNEWKYVAEMVTDFDASLPPVPCLPAEFNQVILNLIVNAAHAIADVVGDGARGKGAINVSTRRASERAEIRIQDTGGGIPEKIRERIFEPFFTTKAVGKGTGQGLAIARSVVVDKHGGEITFETEPGKGTTFIISIPINPALSAGQKKAA